MLLQEVDNWILAIEAVYLISLKVGGDRNAKRAISDRLRDNTLNVTGDWFSVGADIGDLPGNYIVDLAS
jgi:hypothetical protein